MANLSNINGKFVVEQTTGYVGVGTTDPSYPIEVLNASAEIALNASVGSIYRLQSDSASNFIIRKEGVGDRLIIDGSGNSTFAGNVTTASPLTIKAAAPYIQWENVAGTRLGYIQHNATDLSLQADIGSMRFGTGATALTIDTSQNSTFAGQVNVGTNLLMNNNKEIRWLDSGGAQRTVLELDSNDDLYLGKSGGGNLYLVNGTSYTTALTIDSSQNSTFAGNVTAGGTDDATALFLKRSGGANVMAINTNSNGSWTMFDYAAGSYTSGITQKSGNVGIGTSSPRVQTEIQGLAQATANISDTGNSKGTLQVSDTANALNAGGTILFAAQNDSGTYTPQAAIKSLLQNGGLQGIGDLAFSTRNATSDTTLTERMRIDSSGKVKIGQDVGGSAFNGASVLQLSPYTSGQPVYIGLKSDTSNNCGILMGDSDDSYVGGIIYNNSNNYLVINTNNAERMRIDSSGNVAFTEIIRAQGDTSYYASGVGVELAYNSASNRGQIGVFDRSNSVYKQVYFYGSDYFFDVGGSEKMRITSGGVVQVGTTPGVTPAILTARKNGTCIEFGHTNNTGRYEGTLGVFGSSGNSYIGFATSCDNSANTFTTRGAIGNVITGDNSGNLNFQQATNANASGQTLTQRMRISNVGRVTINTTIVTDARCTIAGDSSHYALNLYADVLYSSVYRYQRFRSGSNIAGGIEGPNQTSVVYNTSSDYRMKKNIKPLENGLERLSKLKPVKFDWKLNDESTEGFIAHEVQKIFPDAISGEKDGEDMQGMDYGRITPLLVAAIQELKAEIEILKNK